jgi:carboxyl-terminal processing protease
MRLGVASALIGTLAVHSLAAQDSMATRHRTVYEDLQMFSQVLNQIRVNHPDSVDTHELFMAAIRAMVRAADPHSYVLVGLRGATEKAKQLADGKLDPVPIAFDYIGGSPVVVSVEPGSEAARLDILPGDELVSIDTASVKAESAAELDIELAGPRHSTVTLGFQRRRLDGSLTTLRRVVRRERVADVSQVPAALMLDSQTGYVRITSFESKGVADEVRAALSRLEGQGMRRLLLDLRDNGGGVIKEAANVAGEFLPTGTVVYTSEGRKRELDDTVRVKRSFWRHEKRYPVVVLVNNGTASASELLAAALQDHDRAIIAGQPTFGKALMMEQFPLADGSAIMLVVGRVRTPCGRIVQRQYRHITTREYYRLATAARDTVGLPSCHTDAGRVGYGGDGIFPDVVLAKPQPRPLWLAPVFESDLLLQWTGGYVEAHRADLGSPEAFEANPRLPPDALSGFRDFATAQGVPIPATAAADTTLDRVLLGEIAFVAFGRDGFYRVHARIDPEVSASLPAFDRAEAILSLTKD